MSRIDALVREHCPTGVPYRAVSEVTEHGSNVRWAETGEGKFRYIDLSSVDRVTRKIGDTITVTASDAPSRAQQIVREGDVIFATTRPTQMRWAVIPSEYDAQIASTGYCVLRPLKSELLTNYLAHLLGTDTFRQYLDLNQVAGNYPSIPDGRVRSFRIPVPHLEVQREIVKILDNFTELEAELEAELKARRVQHAHYRDGMLLAHDSRTSIVKLGQVAEIFIGFPFKSALFSVDDADMALIRGDNIAQGYLKSREFKRWKRSSQDGLESFELRRGDVVLAMDRPWIPAGLKWATISDDILPALLVQRVARLRPSVDVLDQRYLATVVSSAAFTKHVLDVQTGNTVPHISGGQIGSFQFSLPPLPEQRRMTAALDKFDALVNDLNSGLPAELAARRKQYEYYRDKLLTFEGVAG